MPLRGRYDLASGEGDVVERSVELGERPEQVLPTRKLANQLASKGERPELTVPVVDSGCRLERLCGNIAGVDCESAVDGPYVCYDMTRWSAIAHCGGYCMGGQCTNCPPQGFGCPTY